MPLLFSYGTLQQESVQRSLFGRSLHVSPDELIGFALEIIELDDPDFVAKSGKARHTIVRHTGDTTQRIHGMALEVTEDDLAKADEYEPPEYARIGVTLASGREAWVYAGK